MFFAEKFKNLRRIREIIQILVKYGFEDIITNSTLRNFVSEKRRLTWMNRGDDKPIFAYTRWERIRMATEELGPTFIKLAQVLSNRPDMLPDPLIKELEKLQDHVPPFDSEHAKKIIENETGFKIEDLFDEFTPNPIASASIGQVHKAKLKTGEEVVIKVQRPEIRELIDRDLAILKDAVRRSDRYLKRQGILNASDIVRVFERSMHKELDYRNEARNIDRFRNTYHFEKKLCVPKVYRKYTTNTVMVLEFVKGCKINDVRQLREWGLNPHKVVENGMHLYLTQIFEYGFFHADPHPGNVLVRKDGVICLIDFGMMGQLAQKDKTAFAGMFISLARQDSKGMASNMKKLAVKEQITDIKSLQYDLEEIIEDYATLDVSESSIAEMTTALQKVMMDHTIIAPPSVFLIFRAFAILEGIGKQMHPNFNTYDFIKPYGRKIFEEQFKPENLFNEISSRVGQFTSLINSLPYEFKDILEKIRRGKIHIEIEHQGYGYLLKKMDSITNRIIVAMLIVALIIGSSITMLAKFPPEYYTTKWIPGIPYISLTGILTACGLTIILFWSILRRRVYK
jgi:ubiquinone biosynthesis protein